MHQWRHVPLTSIRSRSVDSIRSRVSEPRITGPKPANGEVPKDWVEPHTYSAVVPNYNEVPTFPERPHYEEDRDTVSCRTLVVTFDGCPNDPYHPVSMPIYQTATFVQPSVTEFGPYDYTRSGNPTRTALETLVAKLEGAHAAFAFSTGMSALATLIHLFKTGDEVIACADLYGGMHRLLTQVCGRQGINVKFVDTTRLARLERELSPSTVLVHIESPSNPLMRITDLKKLADMCRKNGTLLSVDATMMSPILMQPLALGCDISMHSATKFISGHSDTMAGILAASSPDICKRIAFLQNAEGTALAPFDCWLLLRGIKTMALRVERSQENARHVAHFLLRQDRVRTVHYTGLHSTENPKISVTQAQYEVHCAQAKGPGSVLSFETGDVAFSQRVVNACQLFKITVSFGSCSSLIEMPCLLSHASIPAEKRTLPDDLVRLSIGIEDARDIVDDLAHAFRIASAPAEEAPPPSSPLAPATPSDNQNAWK
jgi:cystathionine beta-lyase